MTEELGSAPTGNLSRHSLAEKSRCSSILSPESPMTLAPAAAKFSMFSANSCASTVQTLVIESDAATGKEKAARSPDQKKNRLAAESDRSNRSNNQRANSDWTTKPPANASRLHDRARRAERLRQIMLCWRRPARNARVEQASDEAQQRIDPEHRLDAGEFRPTRSRE